MSILGAFAVPHPPIILPEVGHGEESKIRMTVEAYDEVMRTAATLKPQTVIITSPHSVMYADYFHVSPGKKAIGNFANFRAPQLEIEVTYDEELAKTLTDECQAQKIPGGFLGEQDKNLDHGTMIPLYFLNKYTHDFDVVRIGLSGLSPLVHYRFGECIAAATEKLGRRAVLIASGDLSHKLKTDGPYGFVKEGPIFDKECMEALADGDFLRLLSIDSSLSDAAAECGLRSFWIMAGTFDKQKVTARQLSYEGPFGVGYGVAMFTPNGNDERRDIGKQFAEAEEKKRAERRAKEDEYVQLARLSVENFVTTGKHVAMPQNIAKELTSNRAGAFVSLKKNGRLRGCIGTFLPVQTNIAEEILTNAVSACSADPRFEPVKPYELPDLVYSVDILSAPEPIDGMDKLDVKRYGVIVANGNRRGLLLPDLAGVDTVEEQVSIAKRKGNIGQKEPVELYRFEVVRHH